MGKKYIAVVMPYYPVASTLASFLEDKTGGKDEAEELGNLINKIEGVKANPEDWAKFEQRIALRMTENSRMKDTSLFNVKNNSKPTL